MLNCGLGECQVNNLLSALNIPSISASSLKAREREVGEQIQEMAKDSCGKHLQEEADM